MQSSQLKKLAFGVLALAACSAMAEKAPAWVSTRTQAFETGSAVHGLPMRGGELVDVTVSLELRNKAELDALTAAIIAGKSTRKVTAEEFLKTYAPSEASVKAVVDHLTKSGFTNIDVADNRMLISAEGSAATVKRAFNAELHHFTTTDGRDAYANVDEARVPASLKGIVSAVLGLQTVEVAHHMIQFGTAAPDAAAAGTVTTHSPTDFQTIYDGQSLPPAVNATVGIISDGNMAPAISDLGIYVSQVGFPTPTVLTVNAGRRAGSDTSGTDEWDLDSQDALSTAGGQLKQIIFYSAMNGNINSLITAFNKALTDGRAQVVNASLGWCETSSKSSGETASGDAIFESAVAQGLTFSFSSGDSGSKECGARGGANVASYPAASPYVIAVGGTTVSTTNTTTWAGETTWTDGGGSPSSTEPAPTWQVSSGVLDGSTQRGVPDLAFDGNPSSGANIIYQGQTFPHVGGTSLSSPIFVGFWARIQSMHNNSLVFPAAALYQYGPSNPSLFHDIVSGNNGANTAKPGWDYTSGFGSLDVAAFASFVSAHSGF